MANFPSSAKRRFGTPPALDETSGILAAPEVAPAAPHTAPRPATARPAKRQAGRFYSRPALAPTLTGNLGQPPSATISC